MSGCRTSRSISPFAMVSEALLVFRQRCSHVRVSVPSPPRSLLDRLKFLEDHIIHLEREYPPWAALHFNQPNRGVSSSLFTVLSELSNLIRSHMTVATTAASNSDRCAVLPDIYCCTASRRCAVGPTCDAYIGSVRWPKGEGEAGAPYSV